MPYRTPGPGAPEPHSRDISECRHRGCPVSFDAEAAKGMSAMAVRIRWPRYTGLCYTCGQHVTMYASFEHYIAGDW